MYLRRKGKVFFFWKGKVKGEHVFSKMIRGKLSQPRMNFPGRGERTHKDAQRPCATGEGETGIFGGGEEWDAVRLVR